MNRRRMIACLLAIFLFTYTLPTASAVFTPEAIPDEEEAVYDAEAAVNFAWAYWYVDYWECAQFVSNCLKAGGIEIPLDESYYAWDDHRYWGGSMAGFTNPGVCAGALLKYLSETHPVIVNPRHEDMEFGDVIFMKADNPDGHTGIITGFTEDGEPYHCAHNPKTYNMAVGDRVNFVVKMQYTKEEYAALQPQPPQPPQWVLDNMNSTVMQQIFDGFLPSYFANFTLYEADYYVLISRTYSVSTLY